MAYCPSSNAVIGQTAASCDSCGFEFPDVLPAERPALAWSKLADVSLAVASVLSLLSSVGALVCVAYVLLIFLVDRHSTGPGLLVVLGFLTQAFFSFALYVVFVRVQKDE